MTAALSAAALCLIRGDRCLFQDVGFALSPGEILLLEGTNGSGKTSLLKAIAGLLEVETGDIMWCGRSIRQDRQQYRASLVWFAHRAGFKGDLTAIENLSFESGLRAFRETELAAALARLGVAAVQALPMRVLSAGQQRRVALARMILAQAPLWLMDEPLTNLDTAGQSLVRELVSEHLNAGGMCVMASHQPIDVDAVTHRIRLQ